MDYRMLRGSGSGNTYPRSAPNELTRRVLRRTQRAEDLRELGVTSIGHHRDCWRHPPRSHEPEVPPAAHPGPSSRPPASRAPASPTLMFCDARRLDTAVGRFDPEDLREVIRRNTIALVADSRHGASTAFVAK